MFATFQAAVLADGDDLEEAEVYFGLEVLTRSLDTSMDPNSYWQPNCRKVAASVRNSSKPHQKLKEGIR